MEYTEWSVNIEFKRCSRWAIRQEAKRKTFKVIDVAREDMQIADVREEFVEDRETWRRMIRCGDSIPTN